MVSIYATYHSNVTSNSTLHRYSNPYLATITLISTGCPSSNPSTYFRIYQKSALCSQPFPGSSTRCVWSRRSKQTAPQKEAPNPGKRMRKPRRGGASDTPPPRANKSTQWLMRYCQLNICGYQKGKENTDSSRLCADNVKTT